ncbi:MAG: YceD family protein [Armatimonadota bacterium]
MRYDIQHQLTQRDAEITLEIDEPTPIGTDVEFVGNVTGRITLHNTGGRIAAWGHLEATALMECGRCLVEHKVPLSFDFSETCSFDQIDEPLAYTQVASEDETAAIPLLDGDTVDLSELVRQLLVLHTPPRSLCREACRGLCPHCGENLNVEECECETEEIDPRLAPLRELLQ